MTAYRVRQARPTFHCRHRSRSGPDLPESRSCTSGGSRRRIAGDNSWETDFRAPRTAGERIRRVGKARQRVHHRRYLKEGGHASLCSPYLPRSRVHLSSATPCRPARAPCSRRTSRPSCRRACRCASHARHGRLRRASARPRIGRRRKRRLFRIDASGQSRSDFLEQPAIAVGIAERGERAIARAAGIGARHAASSEQIGFVRSAIDVAGAVEASLTFTPRSIRSFRAASMSATIR